MTTTRLKPIKKLSVSIRANGQARRGIMFDKKLREVRQRMGLTLDEAAKSIGIDASYLCYLETGKRGLSPTNTGVIAGIKNLYGVTFPLPQDSIPPAPEPTTATVPAE